MRRSFAISVLLSALAPSCSSGDATPASPPVVSAGGAAGAAGAAGVAGSAGQGSAAGSAGVAGVGGGAGAGGGVGGGPSICEQLSLPARAFSTEPGGARRGDVAADFTVPLVGGGTWSFASSFLGCESYVFLPDTLTVSQTDTTSLWEADLAELVSKSPKNAHYFFVSRRSTADGAKVSTDAMQKRVDAHLATLDPTLAAHWRARLHVVASRATELSGWLKDAFAGIGKGGFAIDRLQRVRGIGNLADVTRFDAALQAAMAWPWKGNLAYAIHEVKYFDAQAKQAAELDAEQAMVVELWKGETLEQFAETDVTLPSAAELAAFDTLRVEITQACPDANAPEFGNCGAWDYIATLGVTGVDGKTSELARFITSYHRETHWVVDASPMLALLKGGGQRHFRWEFAPEWNKQPTATKLSLRFSNQKKGSAPAEAIFLYSGGPFDATYAEQKKPMSVMIPADAKKVELYTLVTGHGSDKYQCAEFCNHIHHFTVNGNDHFKSFKEAGSNDGCVAQTANGMVPNQGGTWWFGRGGWCPGKQVDPWVVDVTSEVTPGQPAELTYEGLYGSQPPLAKLGDIDLSSYLVISR